MRRGYLLSGWILAGIVLAPAAWAAAALQVEQADGKTLVRATSAKLAAWRPATDEMVVVVPAESGSVEIGTLGNGVTADKFANNGVVGVVVNGVANSWQVMQDGAQWVIRPGSGLKAESVLMLRDGWRVNGQTLKAQSVSAAGKDWQVALVPSAQSVAGSIAGVVRLAGAALPVVAEVPDAKPVEIAVAPKMVAPVAVVSVPELKPAALPMLHTDSDAGKVKVEATAPLRALGQPSMAASELPSLPVRAAGAPRGSMTPVKLSEMLARIEPAAGDTAPVIRDLPINGGLVRLSLPAGMKTTLSPASGGLTKVAVHPAAPMRPAGVAGISSELLPQLLGDVYVPGTLVSLTLPQPLGTISPTGSEALKMAGVSVSRVSAVTATLTTSSSWNQSVLDPMASVLEAQKAMPGEVTPTEDHADYAKPVPADDTPVAAAVVNRILPAREGPYNDAVSDALQVIANAPDGSPRARDGQLNLAALYLAWQRPEEALAVLRALPQRADTLPAAPQARLYMGLAELARGEEPAAGLFDQGGQLAAHAKMWRAVAASQAGDFGTALKVWPQEHGVLPQYPGYLRELAQRAQVTALVMVGDRKTATKVLEELIAGYDDPHQVPVVLERLRGLVRMGTPEEAKGLEYLATAAAEDKRDPAEAYRAKYEFVKALRQRHDLNDEQVRKYLTDLWFDWRGDDLEREVLGDLADLYDKENEPREALQYWETLVRAYPKAPELSRVTAKMTDAFLRVFDPENPKIYDTLAYIGMYYDFSELVPDDARGDAVQEQVAKLLSEANLWRRATPILEQQLDHRPLDPAAQGRLALLLADAYGNLGNAADGIKLLDKWQHVATTAILARSWKVEEARLMMQLNRPDAATKALAGLPDDDADVRDQRIDAAWAAQNWKDSVPLLQAKMAHVQPAQLVSDTGLQLATFRLGYAYGQLRDAQGLDSLTKRYAPGLVKVPQLADGIGAVAAGTGVSASLVAAGPLAPVTGALNDLNRLADTIQTMRDTLADQRKQQQDYDSKMRYMDLLPPPAI